MQAKRAAVWCEAVLRQREGSSVLFGKRAAFAAGRTRRALALRANEGSFSEIGWYRDNSPQGTRFALGLFCFFTRKSVKMRRPSLNCTITVHFPCRKTANRTSK